MSKKPETIFARNAVVGMHYITKDGHPVTVLSHSKDKKTVTVKADLTGREVAVDDASLFRPYKKELISKKAREAERLTKTAAALERAAAGGEPKPRVKKSWVGKMLERVYKGKTYKVAVKGDGFVYEGKGWTSLSALAKAITKRPEVDGPRWFGLRKVA